ncbi:hypothetical protein GCM10007160_21280 [Litchfieldella qijiaojingensis]|uniref:Uncharacterized protein n=1 Tax=Litchfieldella qijiaojingensis TaxID=980347 RepID=A0ABQ2YS42_9GAMM|nr:hypothetical protein [Halomonas qijiaojingensis]GGX93448.1 hypothetical protein GCM10007160_21280 [Halomonas qijiaojingensis]
MSTQYEISISMNSDTVDKLKNGGFALYGFKAVKTASQGGAPLVWFQSTSFLDQTEITWEEQYQAYISTDEIIANGRIQASASADIDLEQTMNVSQNGTVDVYQEGTPHAISILNRGKNPWTCGISQQTGGSTKPMCAFPLYGNNLDVIAPIERVLLMFASNTVNTGTVIYKAYSSGVLVDLTSSQSRSVKFDINDGWDWGGQSWAKSVQAQESLVPLLITS